MENVSDKKSRLSPAKRALLEQRLRGVSDTSQVSRGIPRRPQQDLVPLSFAQQRLWFLDQLQPGNSSYNVSRHVRITGSLDCQALARAFNAVVERHESLRTVFRLAGNEPVQIIQAHQDLPLPLIDLSGLAENERAQEIARLALKHSEIAFSLADGPLLSARLVRLSLADHLLFVTLHHIITDAWSTALLLRELVTLYDSFTANQPSPLKELPIQYADFALWQREFLQGETLEKQLSYWKQQLAGAPAMLELPLDRPRPAVQTFRGAYESFTLSADLNSALKNLARQEGATLFMALLAAFQTLLWRHTRQDTIVIGAPIANRTRKETESLVGFFVNTLVMRTNITADMTFRELLRQVKDTTLAAYSHQDLPFEKLVEELQPERSLSHNPLFQVTLSLQNIPQALGLGNFMVDPIGFDGSTTRLDLEAYFWDLPEGLAGEFVYSTDLFDRRTIQRLLQHFQILLAGLSLDPDVQVSELPLLTPDEREQLAPAEKRTKAAVANRFCIHDVFEQQVERSLQRTALCFDEERLNYDELNRRANRLAHYLIRRGARPERLVGVCVERSMDLVVALLGILKSGAAYVPLDPAYPPERLSLIAKDADFTLVLTQECLAKAFSGSATEIVCFDKQAEEIAKASDQNPRVAIDSEHPAYVIYTSGSTGTPKGVVVTHDNVVRLMETTAPLFHFGADDVWTLFHSYAFDFSVWEIWGALFYGGRLVVVPYLVSRAPQDFYELLCREKVTVLNQTPSAFRQLIQAEVNLGTGDRLSRLSRLSLREVIFGGEALDLQSLKPWVDRHGYARPRLVNMYGITETTVHVSYRPLTATDVENATGSLVGRPLDDLQVYILDRKQQLAPTGVPGEMYVGGAGVARGYLRRSDLTAERFVPDPFSTEPGSRLYRTGDLARFVASDELECDIEYLGRVDRQVKVRGFRIELGEIESVLAQHETVRECLVLARQDNADQQLLAYVVANPGQSTSAESLRAFLNGRLPQYMVPAAFVPLDRLPLTPNGKIDERALPPPDKSRADLEEAFIAPRTETESKLASLWSDVLGREEIGIYDNFFDLGGHSLLATQVMARIHETFNVNLPLRYFFERPTVAGLAEFLRDARREDQKLMPEIRRLPRGEVSPLHSGPKYRVATSEASYPLSSMQQGMLLHSIYDLNGGTYIQQMVCELREPISVTFLTRAWREAVARHAMLRTSFRWEGLAEPVQEVRREVELPFISEDWSDLTSETQEQKIVLYNNADRRRGFELSAAPLMRVALFKLGERDYRMIWTFHHALLDGRSHLLVLKEVFEVYDAYHSGNAAKLEQPRPYSDYIKWLSKQDLPKAEIFWRQALHGFRSPTVLRLPAPSRPEQGHATQQVRLSAEVTSQLRSLAQRNRVTLNNLVQAGWALLLSLYSGEDDVLFGTTRACRHWTSDGPESMVGLYINTLPFRVQRSDRFLLEWLRELRAQHVALREYEHTPLMKIQGWSEVPRGTPLFDSVLVFEDFQMNIRLRALGERWGARNFVLLEQTNYPLTLAAYASSDLFLKLEYDQQRFDAQSIERVLNHLQRLLAGIAANPDRRVREVSLLTETGR